MVLFIDKIIQYLILQIITNFIINKALLTFLIKPIMSFYQN